MELEGTPKSGEKSPASLPNTNSRVVRDYLSVMCLQVLLKFVVDVVAVGFLLALAYGFGLLLCKLGGASIGISTKHVAIATALLGFIYLGSILAVASRRLWGALTQQPEQQPNPSPSPAVSEEITK